MAEFRNRPLDGSPYTFVWIDALMQKVREGGRVVNVACLLAVGAPLWIGAVSGVGESGAVSFASCVPSTADVILWDRACRLVRAWTDPTTGHVAEALSVA